MLALKKEENPLKTKAEISDLCGFDQTRVALSSRNTKYILVCRRAGRGSRTRLCEMSDLFLPTLSLLFDYHSSFSFKSETRYSNFHLFVFIPFAFSSFVRKCCFLINLKLLLDDCFFPFLACRSLIAFGSLQSVPLMFPFVSDNGRRRCVLEER